MAKIPLTQLLTKSVERTRTILFRPFCWKKWLLLLCIAFLAGALGGGSGSGGSGGGGSNNTQSQQEESVEQSDNGVDEDEELIVDGTGEVYDDEQEHAPSFQENVKAQYTSFMDSKWRVWIIVLVIVMFLLLIGVWVFFTWLGARFRFVWFNAIVNNAALIKEPFMRYRQEGNALFIVSMIITAIFFACLGFIGGWIFLNLRSAGVFAEGYAWSLAGSLRIFLVPVLSFIALVIAGIISMIIIDHFIVTIMALDRSPFVPAWHQFVAICKSNMKGMLLYVPILFVLNIAAGICKMILGLGILLALGLIGLILFGVPFLLFWLLLKVKIVFIIFSILVGIPFAIGAILLFLSIGLPFAVFFRNFSLYYLSNMDCAYMPLPLDEA